MNFFRSLRTPYYIYAADYRHSSAGIRCLHYLCHALNEFGEEAYIANASVRNPYLRTPPLTSEIMERHFLTGRTPTVLYPEVVKGNPLNVPLVSRWLLNRPGHLGGDSEYDKKEMVFFFNTWVLPPSISVLPMQLPADFVPAPTQAAYLNVPTVDQRIFNNLDNPHDKNRKGSCYYANKYLAFGGAIDARLKNSRSLCHDVPLSPEQLADVFRKSEVLYSYEHSSIVSEALACGCPVAIIPSEYWDAHGEPSLLNNYGIYLDGEEGGLKRAQGNVHNFQHVLKTVAESAVDSVRLFIQLTGEAHRRYQKERLTNEDSANTVGYGNLSIPWHVRDQNRKHYLPQFRDLCRITDRENSQGTQIGPQSATNDTQRQEAIPPQLRMLELALFEQRSAKWPPTVFHLIIIEEDAAEAMLTRTLQSLLTQHYQKVIATIVSIRPAPFELGDGRLEWWHTPENPGMLVNEVISASPADWCGVIRVGDTLAPHAFLAFGEYIYSHKECCAAYCDEDVIDEQGNLSSPNFKPDFDLDQLRANAYVGGLLMARKAHWMKVGGWRPLPRHTDEFDAALRLADGCLSGETLGHLSGIFYHRTNTDPTLQPIPQDLWDLRSQLVQESLLRQGIPAIAENGISPSLVRIRYLLDAPPRISVVIPTRDRAALLERCLTSFVENTDYPDYEILVIDNGSSDPEAQAFIDGLIALSSDRVRVLPWDEPFNLSAIFNFAASNASGELLLFLHDDVAILHREWLFNMAALCMRQGVAVVGGRLVQNDGTLQQGWIIPSTAGIVPPPFHGWPTDAPTVAMRLNAEQEVSAVGCACMLVRKDLFAEVGGMDADRFPERCADIDLCLGLRGAGYRILWTPYATLLHDSDNSQEWTKDDNNSLLAKWGKALVKDPFFNPYLALGSENYLPEAEPAFLPDIITWHPMPNVYGMSSDFDGAGHYRVIQPLQEATAASLIRGRLGRGYPIPAILEKLDIDIIFSQRQLDDKQLQNLARYRKLLGTRIVMDFDDLLTKVPDKSIHKKDLHKDMKARLRQLGSIAHRFTVSTLPLAEEFREFHEDIRVIPNALVRSQWAHLTSQRRTSKKLRVGWAGGVSHRGDLEIIRDVVRDTAKEVDWVFMGMCLTELAPYIREFVDGVQFSAYPDKLASLNLDLAVAPLELNHFNECKSHLRILEYGILGIPVIATEIFPYRSGFPIALVKNKHRDWVKAIRDHANAADELAQRGDTLRQYILDHWMLDQHINAWQAAWTEWN